ncbi:unnamed protein product [Cyprideis torosa]|uniref:Protein aurora borealis n=1 Tax=Cyprideis torosa TaxID=163714 RepID=A0A7R8ZQ04_9CRUS|nr:unnamed protein product [Cyprideis torosa]CAG0891017.1 unnamed protein product [Cyprideis torosa]
MDSDQNLPSRLDLEGNGATSGEISDTDSNQDHGLSKEGDACSTPIRNRSERVRFPSGATGELNLCSSFVSESCSSSLIHHQAALISRTTPSPYSDLRRIVLDPHHIGDHVTHEATPKSSREVRTPSGSSSSPRPMYNPFERDSLDSLQKSFMSPSLILSLNSNSRRRTAEEAASLTSSPEESGTCQWSIEVLSQLYPADIDEKPRFLKKQSLLTKSQENAEEEAIRQMYISNRPPPGSLEVVPLAETSPIHTSPSFLSPTYKSVSESSTADPQTPDVSCPETLVDSPIVTIGGHLDSSHRTAPDVVLGHAAHSEIDLSPIHEDFGDHDMASITSSSPQSVTQTLDTFSADQEEHTFEQLPRSDHEERPHSLGLLRESSSHAEWRSGGDHISSPDEEDTQNRSIQSSQGSSSRDTGYGSSLQSTMEEASLLAMVSLESKLGGGPERRGIGRSEERSPFISSTPSKRSVDSGLDDFRAFSSILPSPSHTG